MTSSIRRVRGYAWEDKVVKIFKEKGCHTVRLGGTTTTMPDVTVSKAKTKIIMAIECKSTTTDHCNVPAVQIQRCIDWVNAWELYTDKVVMLAFKFSAKKRVGIGRYESREKKEFFKIWNLKMKPVDFSCSYNGFCKIKETGKDLWLEEYDTWQ